MTISSILAMKVNNEKHVNLITTLDASLKSPRNQKKVKINLNRNLGELWQATSFWLILL